VTLHPQAVVALREWAQGPQVTDPGFGPEDIAAKRAEARAAAELEDKEPVSRVEEVDADGVPCRLYVPAGARSTLVHLHGGGFVFGDLDTHDGQSRRMANRTGSAVLTVGYRRPPEHRFPAAPDDVDTALRWLVARGATRGLDRRRIAVIGDSAGGNLALVAALRNPGAFTACVLVYPFLDPTTSCASYDAEDGGLTRGEARWYWQQYARTSADLEHPDLAPLLSDRLRSLPPTLVVAAEHDVLVDEDVLLARRIEAAGGRARLTTVPGMVHGYWRHPQLFDAAEQTLAEIAGFVADHV
jgi:acetyl esterase